MARVVWVVHPDEVFTDSALVSRLLTTQFPQWAALPIQPVASAGTDNALYRLGDALVVRLPRVRWAVGQVEKEQQWLPKLEPHLPLAVPTPIGMGQPGAGYPWHWSVYRWLDGENVTLDQLSDLRQAAKTLALLSIPFRAWMPPMALRRAGTSSTPPRATFSARPLA